VSSDEDHTEPGTCAQLPPPIGNAAASRTRA
jgi:hypothetical protein